MINRNILILTGAGFNDDVGLPLEKDIMKIGLKVCSKKKPEIIEGLTSLWQKIEKNISFEEYSFEEFLTKVVFEEQYHHHSNLDEREILILKLAVLEILVQSLKIPLNKDIPKAYIEFVKLYKDIAFFATLNYDYLIEKILILEKIPWNYGVQFNENHIGCKPANFYIQNEISKFPKIFKYFKLHGSFNWHFCWRCNNSRLTELKYFGISGEVFSMSDRFTQSCDNDNCRSNSGQAILQPLVVPPSAIKYYNIPIFLELWFEFEKILKSVEKLIIIGCSVRDDDTLLIHSLNNLSKKNSNLKKVVVVDPDKKVETKVRDLTKLEVKRYKNLEDFMLKHS